MSENGRESTKRGQSKQQRLKEGRRRKTSLAVHHYYSTSSLARPEISASLTSVIDTPDLSDLRLHQLALQQRS